MKLALEIVCWTIGVLTMAGATVVAWLGMTDRHDDAWRIGIGKRNDERLR